MQFLHSLLPRAIQSFRSNAHSFINDRINPLSIGYRRFLQYVVNHFLAIAGMSNTNSQALKKHPDDNSQAPVFYL